MTKTELLRFIDSKDGNASHADLVGLINERQGYAFEQGQAFERNRILAILQQNFIQNELLKLAIALIKAEEE